MCLQLWCGDRPCGGPGTHGRSARLSPWCRQAIHRSGGPKAAQRNLGRTRPNASRVPTQVAMAALLVGLVAYFAAYLASVLTSLGILWLNDRASAPVFVVVAIFVAIVVAIPSGVLWMKQWGIGSRHAGSGGCPAPPSC